MTASLTQAREPWQCRYRGAVCPNPRVTKTDGTLHHLCSEHRGRANLNQRRSKERKRSIQNRLVIASSRRRQGRTSTRCLVNDSEWQDILESLAPTDSSSTAGVEILPDEQLFGSMLAQLTDAPSVSGSTTAGASTTGVSFQRGE